VEEILERNRNLNRGFRKLEVWREAVQLYAFEKKTLGGVKGIVYKIRDQILDSGFSYGVIFRLDCFHFAFLRG
jgi:hypothetical protein